MINLVDLFYSEVVGYYPFDTMKERNQTAATIEYLLDCGFSYGEVVDIILKDYSKSGDEIITPDNLPDRLWNNSLIERNKFYYHHELRLTKPLGIKKKINNYLEMKIRFTMNDLVKYFNRAFNPEISDYKKTATQLEVMLKKFNSSTSLVKPIDLVLRSIDDAKKKSETTFTQIYEPWDIQKIGVIEQALESIKRNMAEARYAGEDKVRWRDTTRTILLNLGA